MKLGTVRGIGVYIHWTFWILIAWVLLSGAADGGLSAGLWSIALVGCVFVCIVLHEFGHAAAAARYGIPTADITVLPIGGVARLTRVPDKPVQELVIALAGPAVNVVIAAVLLLLVLTKLVPTGLASPADELALSFVDYLLVINVGLVLFNLLPAFPMDGGRVLRSLLAMRFGHLRATEIAARLGRWMALAFAIYGLFYNPSLLLIAAFIFFAGTAELMGARMGARMRASGYQGLNPLGPGSPGAGSPGAGQAGGWQAMGWQTRVYPQSGTSFDWSAATGEATHDDNVIDAVDVRVVDNDPDNEGRRLN